MRISLIIPALNEAMHVARAIGSGWEAGCDEVVVADGGSSDRTAQLARAHGAQVVVTRAGRGWQQNRAAEHSTGDVLLFLHADNWLSPRAAAQIRSTLGDACIQGGAFRQRIAAPGALYRLLEAGNAWRAGRLGVPYGDQGIFLRRAMYERLGGFPEVPFLEDLILMRQFRRLARPALLTGPIYVSARRWQRRGIIRQTACNWTLVGLYRLGVSPERLAHFYSRTS